MDLVQVTPPTPAAVKVLRPASDVPVLFGTLLVLEVPEFSGKCFGQFMCKYHIKKTLDHLSYIQLFSWEKKTQFWKTGVAVADERVVSSVDMCEESWDMSDMCPCWFGLGLLDWPETSPCHFVGDYFWDMRPMLTWNISVLPRREINQTTEIGAVAYCIRDVGILRKKRTTVEFRVLDRSLLPVDLFLINADQSNPLPTETYSLSLHLARLMTRDEK